MRDLIAFFIVISLAAVFVAAIFLIVKNNKGTLSTTKLKDTIATIDTKAETYDNKAFTFNVQDPNYGGDYAIQRCPALAPKKDNITFEEDINGYYALDSKHQDTLTLKVGAANPNQTVPPATLGNGGKILDDKHTIVSNNMLQKHIGLPAVVPNNDEIQLQMLMGLLSVKDSTLEKELVSKQTVMGVKKLDMLKAIFDDEIDNVSKRRKGLVGMQLMSPTILQAALGDKQKQIKNYVVFTVCEVKSEEEMKNTIANLPGYKKETSESQLSEFVAGLRALKENETVLIPQKAKSLVLDNDKVGVFTSAGRMHRS